MTQADIIRGMEELRAFVEGHPNPDSYIVLSSTDSWSPSKLLQELEARSVKGDWNKGDTSERVFESLLAKSIRDSEGE